MSSNDAALQYALTTIQQNDYTTRMHIIACGKSIPNLSQLLSSLPSDTITVSYGFCPIMMMYQPHAGVSPYIFGRGIVPPTLYKVFLSDLSPR
jgi:hypothetical protein